MAIFQQKRKKEHKWVKMKMEEIKNFREVNKKNKLKICNNKFRTHKFNKNYKNMLNLQ